MKAYIKSCLVILGALVAIAATLSFADAHASNIRIKAAAPEQVYEICNSKGESCHEGNSAEATLAILKDTGRVFIVKRTEQELEAGKKGINLKNKK